MNKVYIVFLYQGNSFKIKEIYKKHQDALNYMIKYDATLKELGIECRIEEWEVK